MNDERPNDSVEQEKDEKKCTTTKIVICTIILSIILSLGSFLLLLWLPAFPWVCGTLAMAYHNTFPSAGHPANTPPAERLYIGTVCLMVILYPMIYFSFLAAAILRLKKTLLKFNLPILFASIPLLYISFLVLLVIVHFWRFLL